MWGEVIPTRRKSRPTGDHLRLANSLVRDLSRFLRNRFAFHGTAQKVRNLIVPPKCRLVRFSALFNGRGSLRLAAFNRRERRIRMQVVCLNNWLRRSGAGFRFLLGVSAWRPLLLRRCLLR